METLPATYPLPASPAQERLWFFNQLVPDLAVYNLPCRVELGTRGAPVDAAKVRAALELVVARHETLRTGLVTRDGQLTQLVHAQVPVEVEYTDLRGLPADRRRAEASAVAAADGTAPIPLDRAPLWRARLVQVADDDCHLVFVVHHAVFDGASVKNFTVELRDAYRALRAGTTPDLPELALQYGDFAAWQRERMAGGDLDDQIAYWQRVLADLPAPLRLPAMGAGRDRDGGPHRGGHVMFALPTALGHRLREVARARRATPYAVLLAGFATLLHRLTGEADVLIGTPVTGRGRPELAPLIGMFVNTLVLRVDCSGDPGLGELVDRVRGTVLDALDNQEVPYDHLVKTLAPDRDAGGSPLHRVVFNLLPGVVSDDVGTGTAKVDLLVDLGERPDGYVGRLEYRRDLFDEPAATALIERLLRLLEAGLADPDVPIGRLPLLDGEERSRLLAGPVATGNPTSVLDMFAERVAAGPDLTAVVDATGGQLTYRALDERANRLARHLARVAPIRPDARVALLVDGGVDLAVAVLAVLKAGAAYVPLDPKNPAQRLRRLIADSGAVAVVSAGAGDDHGLPLVDLRGDAARITAEPAGAPEGRPHPNSLAYVTYTSGSTGEPKGVGVAHRNLAAYVDGVRPLLDTAPGRSFAQLQSLVFDFGATVFYGALLTGGTLHLVTELATDPHRLAEYLRQHPVDLLKITPSHLRALLAGRPDPAVLLPRRTLVLGGEGSDWAWVRDLRQGRAVVNHYGPTETTVGAVALSAGADPDGAGTTTPLGRPLAHAAAYVLDEHGQPVPDGVSGELWLGGATVSRGYLGRPALTADRFRPDPFGERPGARLYRTGDRVRRLPGGDLEFLGRLDDQIKIRGYRVEPGEVRQVLAAAPGVVDCAVVARPNGLVAYVAGSTVDLPAFAAARLPEYMVPVAFVALPELPRAAHGKVDHARLPDPGSTACEAASPAEAPVGDTEELIAGLFTALLSHNRIGRHDGFFALGGHSLLAIQLVSRLRAALGVAVPVRTVFEEPTVAGLAAKVVQRRRKGLTLPAITPVPRDALLPASYGQRRLWFLDQFETGAAVYNTSLYLEIDGELDVELLRRALTAIVERHELLRTRFVDRDGELWQVVRDEAELPFTVVTEPADAESLLREHADRRFDLATEPPLRALLLRLAGGRQQLLVAVHHVANDAWSADLFARELGEHYAALRAGRPAALPALPVQYADYAAWQHRVVTGEVGETQLRYWRERLAGLPEQLTVPADRPRPARRGTAGALAPFKVPAATADRLRTFGVDENASVFMVLLAGYLTVLHRYTGQTDLAVGTPVSTRSAPEVQSLLGFFLNTLVLRADCAGEPTFRELVRRARSVTLDALAHQEVPFEALVEELRPRRDLGGTPLVQTLFTVEDTERAAISSDGITLAWRPFGTPTAKFDLSLYLWRQPDGLSGAVEYRTDLFDDASMQRLAGHYTAVLEAALADPDTPVSRLDMAGGADLALIDRWNDTAAPEPFVSVPAGVAAAARAHPDAPALVWRGQSISYRDFAAGVRRLAAALRARGTGPGDVVAVLLERGPELVTAVHAIQAAGAAYLPLDPEHPAARLAFQCRDAAVRVAVTSVALADRLAGTGADPLLAEAPMPEAPDAGPEPVDPASPAYVIYTSGSTGEPKGVVVPHSAIANRLAWMQRTFPLRPGEDRVLHKTPAGFDVSVWELFWPLLTGAALVIAEPGGHRDPGYLAGLLADERVTTVHFVPSMLDSFLDEPGLAERLPALRRVVCSGEALSPALADRCQAALPHAWLHNLYGPTEAAVDVSWHACRPGEPRVPIGAPITNTQLRVLDRHGRPAPIGVPGELCIAGIQLANGYLNRPALTAERFVPDPYGPPGSRLYRTGDLARWLPDGELEYHGRLDDQIKIRGMRVEPGEIEAALLGHPAVRAAAVTVLAAGAGHTLAGYVVPADPDHAPTVSALREHLAGQLPAHLVPAVLHAVAELPLTASGKLNRAALPSMPVLDAGQDESGTEFVAPATAAERAVAGVWESVLGLDRVGAADDFFTAGGDSIRALKVVARLRDAGYRLELVQLFEHQTVRDLAAALAHGPASYTAPAVPFDLLEPAVADRVRSRWPSATDGYPLTSLQTGMLFANELDGSGATYHDVFTLRLAGAAYRPDVLADALARAGAAHPILRTSLHVGDFDEPVQVVHARAIVPLSEVDHRAAADATAALAAFEEAEKRHRFDPAAAPLLRVFLHRLPADEQALTLSFHHAILDGWSVATLATELLRGYAGGREPAGAAPPPAYRDFVAEELARRSSPESEGFWREVVTGAPPGRLPRLAAAGGAGIGIAGAVGALRTEVDAGVAAALGQAARTSRVPLRTVLLAAHLRATALLTGDPDAVTGVVTSSRPRHESGERVLGMFLNTIPIRVRVDRPSWSDLIRGVYEAEVAAIPHRAFPLVDIHRLAGGGPVFDTLFDYRDFHVYRALPSADRLRVTGYRFFEQIDVPFAVNLIRGAGDTLTLQVRYDSGQFSTAEAERISDLHLRVLAAIARDVTADPRPAAGYLAPDIARIEGWNATQAPPPAWIVPERLAAQAARTPDRDALVASTGRLTYAGLLARVHRLAHHLREAGVRPDGVVGICLPRGVDFVVALHAIQAAGSAYLPLDPDYPPERLALMAADAGATTVVTTAALAVAVPGTTAVHLDTEAEAIAARPETAPELAVHPDSLAYVIYTSGSTGRPKGVGVSHRAIANRLAWMQHSYPIGPEDRVLHKTPASFDVSVWELCWPLLTGAAMVIADPGDQRSPNRLLQVAEEHRVTVVHFVPSMLDAVVEEPDLAARLAGLRLMFCSGEALAPALAARVLDTLPDLGLHNLYGPTEAAVDVTHYPCVAGGTAVPIGRPVANTRIEVLDATGQRVPVGSPGELCIGGVQLARGYLNRPALTAERFVPDPYGPPGARLYRTGDLARWLPEGELDYLGRLDHQVKVRGFRIEPGEIEAALAADPAVRSAVVLAPPARDGSRSLVAYVVPETGGTVDGPALAQRLRGHLPEHLVPAVYVPLRELPLTANGKLDRAALPAPDPREGAAHVPAGTDTERAVAAIWGAVLGAATVSVEDDFFALGGDSIRSLKVIARLRAAGLPAAISDLYRHPTVRGLAGAMAAGGGDPAPPAEAGARPGTYGLVDSADLAIMTRLFGGNAA